MKHFIIPLLALISFSQSANARDERKLTATVEWSDACENMRTSADTEHLFPLGVAALAIIGPKVIGGAIDAAATALKKAGEDSELAHATTSSESRPYAVNDDGDIVILKDHECLSVYWGDFDANNQPTADSAITFRAKIEKISGTSMFRLVPTYVKVGKFAKSSFFSSDKRNYSIALTLLIPGAEKPFATAAFSLKDVSPGDEIQKNDVRLRAMRSDLLSLPPIPDTAKKAQTNRQSEIAPYVLAADLIQKKTATNDRPQLAKMPTVYSSRAKAAIHDYCEAQIIYNEDRPDQFALNDDICAYHIAELKELATSEVTKAGKSNEMNQWAQKICGKAIADNVASLKKLNNNLNLLIPDPTVKKGLLLDKLHAETAKKAQSECPYPAQDRDVAKRRYGVMTTSVAIVEIKPGSKTAEFFGNLIASAKDDIAKDISNRVIPSLREAAEQADATADRNARHGVLLADLQVTKANNLLDEALSTVPPVPADITSARASLLQAQIAANDAYRLSGQAVPYPAVD